MIGGPHTIYTSQPQTQVHSYSTQERPVAIAVAEQVWNNPEGREYLKQQASQLGGHAVVVAKHYGHKGLIAFNDYIQQGPRGVSTLCFVGGTATSVVGVMMVCNVFGSLVDPFHYILSVYMFAFGVATACIEADTDRIGTLIMPFDSLAGPITRAQAWLHEECKFLTTLRGRGLFYLYQGTLMVTQCIFCMLFVAGMYCFVMGTLCIMMSFGLKPDVEGWYASAGYGPRYNTLPAGEDSLEAPLASAARFSKAEAAWRENKHRLAGKTCRELWALYQQATIGDCNVPKPTGVFNGNDKEQWRLWSGLAGLPADEAKSLFVDRLLRDGIAF